MSQSSHGARPPSDCAVGGTACGKRPRPNSNAFVWVQEAAGFLPSRHVHIDLARETGQWRKGHALKEGPRLFVFFFWGGHDMTRVGGRAESLHPVGARSARISRRSGRRTTVAGRSGPQRGPSHSSIWFLVFVLGEQCNEGEAKEESSHLVITRGARIPRRSGRRTTVAGR